MLDLKPPSTGHLKFSEIVIYHAGDITDQVAVQALFDTVKPEIVFHTAGLIPQIAQKSGLDTEESYLKVNYEGTKIMLDESRRVGVVGFVYTSSAEVVKASSWQNLGGVDEDFPSPTVFDGAYDKSKVRFHVI